MQKEIGRFYAYVLKNYGDIDLEKKMKKINAYADLNDFIYSDIVVEDNDKRFGKELFGFTDKLDSDDTIVLISMKEISNNPKVFLQIMALTWSRKIKISTLDGSLDSLKPCNDFIHTSYYGMAIMSDFFVKPIFVNEEKINFLKQVLSEEDFLIIEDHFEYSTKEEYENKKKDDANVMLYGQCLREYNERIEKGTIEKYPKPENSKKPVIPYGWGKFRKTIIKVEEEQKIIERIKFMSRDEGLSYIEIVMKLNEEKIKPPGRHKLWNIKIVSEIEQEVGIKDLEKDSN